MTDDAFTVVNSAFGFAGSCHRARMRLVSKASHSNAENFKHFHSSLELSVDEDAAAEADKSVVFSSECESDVDFEESN